MTAAVAAPQDAFAGIPEEDRLYPLPLNAPAELGKPEHKREFKIAQSMGAVRLPGAGFLVPKPELSDEQKDRLRLMFGGAANKRKRDEALQLMKAERDVQRQVEGEARTATGDRQRNYYYTVPGEESDFSVERLKAVAKEAGIKLEWDPQLRLRYTIGEMVPEQLAPFRTDAAREAYEQSFGQRAEKQIEVRGEAMAQGAELARKLAAADQGIVLPDPATDPRGFSQKALALSEMTGKDLMKRIRDTAAVLEGNPENAAAQRSLRVAMAVLVDAGDKPVDDGTLTKVGISRASLPAEALQAPRADERRLLAIAYGWDQVKQKQVEPANRIAAKPKATGRSFGLFDR